MHTITPHVVVRDAARAVEWYTSVLGAEERLRITVPDGRLMSVELRFGDSAVMLADEFPEMGIVSPQTLGGTYMALHLMVDDVDRVWQRALDAAEAEAVPAAVPQHCVTDDHAVRPAGGVPSAHDVDPVAPNVLDPAPGYDDVEGAVGVEPHADPRGRDLLRRFVRLGRCAVERQVSELDGTGAELEDRKPRHTRNGLERRPVGEREVQLVGLRLERP